VVDANDAVHPGAYPGALRDLLGLEVEEFLPLRAGETVRLEDGSRADVWAERIAPRGAEPVLRYVDGPAAGGAAVTRHPFGRGRAWYVSTRLTGDGLDAVLRRALADAGVAPRPGVPAGLELVFAVNHRDPEVVVPAVGTELLTGARCEGSLRVPAGEVRVVRQDRATA
jgi:beta-galactosidase